MSPAANTSRFDVAIAGAGMVGAATAALLGRAGFSVAIIEGREARPFDASEAVGLRVSAFSPGSAAVLTEAGAWPMISQSRYCPYPRMVVEDRNSDAVLRFDGPEFGLDHLGCIVENDLVQWSLWQSLRSMPSVHWFCPNRLESFETEAGETRLNLESGQRVSCRLMIAADGANSSIRTQLGIEQDYWDYGQQGLVSVIQSEVKNPGIAWQRFLDGGPIAFLPLANGCSSIVWSQPAPRVSELLELDDEAFLAELQSVTDGYSTIAGFRPGTLQACGPRAAFPLTMRLCKRYDGPRTVLVGDAAHVVHPLAGQGVNLGLMDAAALVEQLVRARREGRDIGSSSTLRTWARARRSEAELMARGIHSLRALFLPTALGPIRGLGLKAVSGSWMARDWFIRRATGTHALAPALARGTSLNELIHEAA